VTSAIIGPRTLGQLEDALAGAGTHVPDEVWDRVDALVAPGVTLNPYDDGYEAPELRDPSLRRRR
jgi:hypothetical protein